MSKKQRFKALSLNIQQIKSNPSISPIVSNSSFKLQKAKKKRRKIPMDPSLERSLEKLNSQSRFDGQFSR